jgi:cytoskeletal protein CcmA (bactofilin family)
MRKLFIGFLVVLTMLFAVVPAASAFDLREGTRETITKDEVIDDDVLMVGTVLRIEGTVNGDVFAFGDTVFVTGTINGNLITAASHIEINGPVNGTVFSAGDDIFVNSRVARSLVAAGSDVVVDKDSSIGHSILAAGDRVNVDGTVGRGTTVGANSLWIRGKVGKELRAYVSNLRIESSAVIDGPVEYSSDKEAFIASGAKTGPVDWNYARIEWDNSASFWTGKWWKVISFISFLGFGLILLALFPSLRRNFPQLVLEKPWQLPLTGFVSLIAIPIGLVILLLTVIGIPFSLMGWLAFPVLIYFGQVLVSYAVGKLLGDYVPQMQNWSWPLLFLIGALLTTIAVELPYIGWVFGFASVLYGLGGALWLVYSRRHVA